MEEASFPIDDEVIRLARHKSGMRLLAGNYGTIELPAGVLAFGIELRVVDAAVLTHKPNGKVEIVKRTEEPTRQGAAKGLLVGLAVGAIVALFPTAGPDMALGFRGI